MRKQEQSEYSGFRRAGIRLNEELIPGLVPHDSAKVQRTLFAAHLFDKAHLVSLVEEQLVPHNDGVAMLQALRDMEHKGVEKVRLETQGGNHSGEQYLIRLLGEDVGGRIHMGRSSPDFTTVTGRIGRRTSLLKIMEELNALRDALLGIAARHYDTIMPAYSHGQHAQPTTYGHLMLAWVAALGRDFERLFQAFKRENECPAGSAILSGAGFPLNRHRVSELMGFDRPIANTFDATQHADNLLQSFCAVSILHSNLMKWCEDILLFTTSEFNMLVIPDRFCGTSSIMMQKKNVYSAEEIKGAAAEAIGGLTTAFIVEKDITSFPVLDRQYSIRACYTAMDTAVRNLKWLTEMLPEIEVRREHMQERAGEFWGQATDIAEALVRETGLNWRSAHQIVAILVRHTLKKGLKPSDATLEMLDAAAIEYFDRKTGLSNEAFQASLDPVNFIMRRDIFGGAAPNEAARRHADFKEQLEKDRQVIADLRSQQEAAASKLESAINTILVSQPGHP
ncbi:argininosuccinate lyase [Pararhizobium sp. YC-54]|uniref:argininosuccinate lyase n=1 Tax=Pararhizobium sp. YC-54 TaxID=2986920 RepID=UPI0021F6EA6C|nr:argininosuccinate lyase [Pararhizobium sp. YC-54]MCW0001532.1 argininosuccinate lyase [Pararhizobium sp. YC-54]